MNIAEMNSILNKQKVEYNDAKIAELWGMDASTYSRKKKTGSKIKEKNLKQVEALFNISLTNQKVFAEGIKLDYYPDVKASCGNGNYIDTETKEQIVIPPQAIQNYSPHNRYTVIVAQSDSMQPEIRPNDRLVIQHNIDRIVDNHIYIFSFDGELFCKYLSNNLGQIVVRSANKDYPIRYIEGEALNNFRLIGEVKAHIREYGV